MLFEVVKYGGYATILTVIYVIYKFIVQPYLVRVKYGKYQNVLMVPCESLIMGDFKQISRDVIEGKPYYHYYRTNALENMGKDVMVTFMGAKVVFRMVSLKAHKEFSKMTPSKIDRAHFMAGIGKLAPNSLVQMHSDDEFRLRRKTFTSILDLNFSSKYIPLMLESIKTCMKNWKVGSYIELVNEMNLATYAVINNILFGEDSDKSTAQLGFKLQNGGIIKFTPVKFLIELAKDLGAGFFHPKSMVLPFLNKYNIGEPFKTNKANIDTFWAYYREFLKNTKDENSAYFKLKQTGLFNEDTIFYDLMSFLFGGFETTSHTLASALYFGKKFKFPLQKLILELEKYGIKQFEDNIDKIDKEKILEIDYLNYYVKEALRIDGPIAAGLPYEALEDVKICGVKIPKGSQINPDSTSMSYNREQWHEPMNFIPDRFDPNSEYFKTPSHGKNRDPFSFIPFMFGGRKCPGQTLAMLEAKTIFAYVVSSIEFELHPDIANRDDQGFGLGSTCKCLVKVTKNIFA